MKRLDRYEDERQFWNSCGNRILDNIGGNFLLPGLSPFEHLCKHISYLRAVPKFLGPLSGRRILDLGCGDGWISLSLAKSGANVCGVDISPKLVALANEYAVANGLHDRVSFRPMSAEELEFPAESFDAVIVHQALHHFDISATVQEIKRILRDGGKAVIVEDLAYHPLLNIYRRLTPHKHTHSERPLRSEDVECVLAAFGRHQNEHFGLLDIVETSNYSIIAAVRPLLRHFDALLYRIFPPIKRYSQLIVLFLEK